VSVVPSAARRAVLAWYDANGRRLAFRGTQDPWAVLVSEVIAQQTQAERAASRWEAFMARFPTVHAVASATPADVLDEWRGLGYNRRALNLWRSARVVVEEHDGRLPADVEALERLPGVGPYTARAVAAIAFGQRVGAVDVNVRRVLGRLGGGEVSQSDADASVPPGRAADWTHAVMDLGATVCRARAPLCSTCPVRAWCAWRMEAAAISNRRITPATPFTATRRWLRGRLVDRLRDAGADGWAIVEGPLSEHDATAVESALAGLAADGLIERDPVDPRRCRLPLA
jgi:A/G-specific adenine glycosylase